ncbi:hypothetical protein HPB48_020995 [Haemaphysalis longicornis]|uniref:Uncharacterized protein n=1 Tax=Haemaphysalis longicornis TaxID=44386 RepID=A0A9J6GJN5_HAELO|nr:hypothetical protein HPB48_020995 [Haemaphysalis longicornis]
MRKTNPKEHEFLHELMHRVTTPGSARLMRQELSAQAGHGRLLHAQSRSAERHLRDWRQHRGGRIGGPRKTTHAAFKRRRKKLTTAGFATESSKRLGQRSGSLFLRADRATQRTTDSARLFFSNEDVNKYTLNWRGAMPTLRELRTLISFRRRKDQADYESTEKCTDKMTSTDMDNLTSKIVLSLKRC